jgi:hypothetical protein
MKPLLIFWKLALIGKLIHYLVIKWIDDSHRKIGKSYHSPKLSTTGWFPIRISCRLRETPQLPLVGPRREARSIRHNSGVFTESNPTRTIKCTTWNVSAEKYRINCK